MLGLLPNVILFDLEYTVWEGSEERSWSGENEFREIVQIGAIKIETETFTELGFFSRFVRPLKNPTLSKYFKDLTGIRQEQIDSEGVKLENMLEGLKSWCGTLPIYVFGRDEEWLKENAKLLNLDFSFESFEFNNIKVVFQKYGINTKGYMSSTITEAFGVKSPYRGHNALNDVRTTALGLKLLSKKTSENQ